VSGWLHEIKHDGHRIIATVEHGLVRLVSRPGNDATRRFAPVAEWLRQLPVKTAIIGCERRQSCCHASVRCLRETRFAPTSTVADVHIDGAAKYAEGS
jgi:hypothetical protein